MTEAGTEVVCDAGRPIHLDELRWLDLLAEFAAILVPEQVWREVELHRPQALRRPDVPVEMRAVELLEVDETRWVEVEDYSARSKSELLLGGKVGRLVYGEGAATFLPLLASGEVAGESKNTASGNGRIEADVLRARGG